MSLLRETRRGRERPQDEKGASAVTHTLHRVIVAWRDYVGRCPRVSGVLGPARVFFFLGKSFRGVKRRSPIAVFGEFLFLEAELMY